MSNPDTVNNIQDIVSFESYPYDTFKESQKQAIRQNILLWLRKEHIFQIYTCEYTYIIPHTDYSHILKLMGTIYGSDTETYVVGINYVIEVVHLSFTVINHTVKFRIYYRHSLPTILDNIQKYFVSFKCTQNVVELDWGIHTSDGLRYFNMQTLMDDVVHTEAYPFVSNMQNYIESYLDGSSNVIIFIGPPGTGKTRFIMHIIQVLSALKNRTPKLLYSMDEKVFSNDEFFAHFFTQDFDVLVLEDIDINLKDRRNGNDFMYKLLGGSDGIIKNKSKKIILSTNLPNIKDIDPALLRAGRCYDVLQMRKLDYEEAVKLVNVLGKDSTVLDSLVAPYLLADIYKVCNVKTSR